MRGRSVIPPLLNTIIRGGGGGGGVTLIFCNSSVAQVRAFATHTPICGASPKAPWNYDCHKLGNE